MEDQPDFMAETAKEEDLRKIWNWNATVPEAVEACVHDLITERMLPEAPAVCAWGGELTYAELDALSSRLAYHLVELGVGPEAIVPLCFEKSTWMPVAMLGVMKAGGAGCAIDITQPRARLQAILQQVQPRIVLSSATNTSLATGLLDDIPVFTVDKDSLNQLPPILPTMPTIPPTPVGPTNTLYLVFTSGSTGTPKGVVITHSNFSSALIHQTRQLGFERRSRVLDMASYAFDAAWYNALHTLYAGGCLCIPSENERRNDLTGCIRRLKPTFINLTPKLCEFLDTTSLQGIDMIELAGEQADARQVGRMRETTSVRFAYGPAECSILSTVSKEDASCSSIGLGLGVRTWIVNADDPRSLMPIGSVGELWIEGPLVGQGYLNDKPKTLAAFVEDPIWLLRGGPGVPGRAGRLYRTGDLVRYDTDGSLLFVGRKDTQVKIRGQRVELGEVEQQILRNLPSTVDTQVVADVIKPRESDSAILVVFLKESEGLTAEIASIEEKLAAVLPTYMIPSAYIALKEIPISQTGKTDRKKLRELGATYTLEHLAKINLARGEWQQPHTMLEKQLQRLWAAVLGINASIIGAADSFLRIGGDSIKAMQLVALAREDGLSLTVADVLKRPRLCDLAVVASQLSAMGGADEVVEPFTLLGREESEVRGMAASFCRVTPTQVEDAFPCTPMQEGLLALTARRPNDYVVRIALELNSTVDVNRFKAAWEEVVLKSPVLRTRIVDLGQNGLTQAIIDEKPQWSFARNIGVYMKEEAQRTTGLGTPLTRFGLVDEEDSGRRFFVYAIHHALCDGWSVPLLLEMVEKVYQHEVVQPAPRFQSFIKHIRNFDERRVANFWREQLEGIGAQPFPQLPSAAYQPKPDMEISHNITGLRWPRTDVTPSILIRAAWSILASQYTGTSDVVFGATMSGRQATVPRIEQMTGPTIATVPVRVVLDPEESVQQLLVRMQEQAIETVGFEQVGLQWIRRLGDDGDRACQFQTLLVIQPAGQKTNSTLFKRGTDDWELGVFNPYGMLLECRLENDGAHLRTSFDSTVIDERQVRRIMQQLEHVLQQLSAPENSTKMLAAVETASQQDLDDIWNWNATVPKGIDACVHDLIAETMRNQPAMPAVCAWNGELTYGELDMLSMRLARRLRKLGVGPEVIVPISFDKSIWAPVAMLGVLRAGGAFAILPPSLPSGRLGLLIEAIKPKVVVASPQHAHLFPRALIFSPEDVADDEDENDDDPVSHNARPSSTAAVLFTSGTTGTPKGILLDHRCLSTTARYLGRDFGAGTWTRVFQFASYLFDVSIHETFMALLYGGCLCVPSESDKENNTSEALVQLRANWACLSPSVGRAILTDSVNTLQTLVFAGEALKETDVSRWTNKLKVFNWYGPAEFSLCASTPVELSAWSSGSIGSGSASTCWVVNRDETDRLMPVGAVGELAVEGSGMMSGYMNDPERTAVVIIENPSWLVRGHPDQPQPGRQGRLYRTGDLVRYNANGSLTYIGRKDAQVKIRGQRVELGDVEHHVLQNLNLEDSADAQVVAEVITPHGSKNPMLVAFVKAGRDSRIAEVQPIERGYLVGLENKLTDILPRHMIPSAYLAIRKVPITPNGKADRRKLRAIGGTFTTDQLSGHSPTMRGKRRRQSMTPTERQLKKLWAPILGIEVEIAVEDSFLQMGGDSIAAMRLVAAAREQGLSFTVADVFKRPRLCDLATVAVAVVRDKERAAKVAIKAFSLLGDQVDLKSFVREEISPRLRSLYTASISDAFPVTHWQATCINLALKTPPQQWHHFWLDLPTASSTAQIDKNCEQLWDNLDILRVVFIRSKICEEDLRHPGILGTPFTRFHALSRPDGAQRLIIRMSHAQYDGTTLIHMMRFLRAVYKNEPPPVSPSFSAFMEYAFNNKHAARRYWRSFLRGSTLTKLERDPSCDDPDCTASPIIVEKLVRMPHSFSGFTPATIFTSACAVFLSKATKSSDVTFGRLVSGRAMVPVHLRNAVGPCVNIIPVRARVSSENHLGHALKSVHEQHIESLIFDTIGFDEIVKHCTEWPRDTHYFGCVTHYQDLGDAEEEFGGVSRRLECYEGNRADTKMMENDVVMILAKPVGNHLKLELAANGGHYTKQVIRGWSEILAMAIEAFDHTVECCS